MQSVLHSGRPHKHWAGGPKAPRCAAYAAPPARFEMKLSKRPRLCSFPHESSILIIIYILLKILHFLYEFLNLRWGRLIFCTTAARHPRRPHKHRLYAVHTPLHKAAQPCTTVNSGCTATFGDDGGISTGYPTGQQIEHTPVVQDEPSHRQPVDSRLAGRQIPVTRRRHHRAAGDMAARCKAAQEATGGPVAGT